MSTLWAPLDKWVKPWLIAVVWNIWFVCPYFFPMHLGYTLVDGWLIDLGYGRWQFNSPPSSQAHLSSQPQTSAITCGFRCRFVKTCLSVPRSSQWRTGEWLHKLDEGEVMEIFQDQKMSVHSFDAPPKLMIFVQWSSNDNFGMVWVYHVKANPGQGLQGS